MEGAIGKELRRNTAACEACQERKRKCDGKAPCSFCVAKSIECKFSQQKKRGPSKKRRMLEAEAERAAAAAAAQQTPQSVPSNAVATISVAREAELFDRIEAQKYLTVYFRFDYNGGVSSSDIDTLLSARTPAHKVQLFAALADAAQSSGDFLKGKQYINQARLLSGSIYDTVDTDSVKGLIMMRKYWYHTLDFTQCTHYSSIAWSLAKLVKGDMDARLRLYCQLSATMSDFSIPEEDKLKFLKGMLLAGKKKIATSPDTRLFTHYLAFAFDFLQHFHFNIFYPHEEAVTNIFKDLNNVHLDESTRLRMLESINAMQIEISSLSVDECTTIVLINRVFCPMYQMLINWKSGRLAEAMANALTCVNAFDALRTLNAAITTTNLLALVIGYTHICMLASMIQFFAEQGQIKLAERVESYIRSICQTRGPEYNSIEKFMAEFRQSGYVLRPTNQEDSPPVTVLDASSPLDSSLEDICVPQICDRPVERQAKINNNNNNNYNNNSNNNNNSDLALELDANKPLTPQLMEQLRAINIKNSSIPLATRYEDDGLKVNNAIVFEKVDPTKFMSNITKKPTPNNNNNNSTIINNNNQILINNSTSMPPMANTQEPSYHTLPANYPNNFNHNNNNNNNTNNTNFYVPYTAQPHNYMPHPSYQPHPSLQQAHHHPYHTTYQLPSHPSLSHPSPSLSHPSSSLSHPSPPSHTTTIPTMPYPGPSPFPAPFNPTLESPNNQLFPPGNPYYPPVSINGTDTSQPSDVINLIDQFLCPPASDNFAFISQDSEMLEMQAKY